MSRRGADRPYSPPGFRARSGSGALAARASYLFPLGQFTIRAQFESSVDFVLTHN